MPQEHAQRPPANEDEVVHLDVCDDESRKYKKKINAEISSAGQRAVDKPIWKILPGVKRKNHKSGECANTSQRWQYFTAVPNWVFIHPSDPAFSQVQKYPCSLV